MKKQLHVTIGAMLLVGAVFAQQKEHLSEDVIIRKDGTGKQEKMTVVIKNDSVFVNGKAVNDGDGPFIVRKKIMGGEQGNTISSSQAFLGVTIEKAENGVRILSVSEGSAAEKAGLKEGDIIVSVAGKTETDVEAFTNHIRAQKPMEEVEVVFIPAGEKKEKKVKVKLGKMESISKTFMYTLPDSNIEPGNLDISMLKNLPDNIDQYFERQLGRLSSKPQLGIKIQDTEDRSGVKVLDVTEQSLAAKAGVQANDLLLAIDGKEVKDTDAAREALQTAREKSAYILKVNRGGKIIELNVKVPKKLKEADL